MNFFIGTIIFIIWLIQTLVLATVAQNKGRSYGAFFAMGLFFSPLMGFIILLAMGENKEKLQQQSKELST